jgi:hypothetical protein
VKISNVDFSLRRALNVELDSLRLSSFSSLRLCVNLNLLRAKAFLAKPQSRKAYKTVRRKAARQTEVYATYQIPGARKGLLIRERGVNMQPSKKQTFSDTRLYL